MGRFFLHDGVVYKRSFVAVTMVLVGGLVMASGVVLMHVGVLLIR